MTDKSDDGDDFNLSDMGIIEGDKDRGSFTPWPVGAKLELESSQLKDERDYWQRKYHKGSDPAMTWQPIETAPKDGTRILVCQRVGYRAHRPVVIARWHQPANVQMAGSFIGDGGAVDHPTHWMPVPDPPA